MYAGYVLKRNAPISPPPMQKAYSVLWGTLLMDYDSEEEAQTSMTPKTCVEVLGVSEWDGKGRANSYPYSFLLVTHTGSTYYISVSSLQERDEWMLNLKRGLECVFANPEVAPFKPSKIISTRPALGSFYHCARTGNALHRSNIFYCKACGRAFGANEYVNFSCTMLQISSEELEKTCEDCRNAQMVILWFKSLNYVHAMTLHELTQTVVQDVRRFKASFRWRRTVSARLDTAAQLLEAGSITISEFEELRQVDHAYRREVLHEESMRLKIAIDAFGDDMQTIIDILLNSSLVDKGGRSSYYNVILKVLDIADHSPDLIDFFFPQLLQVHLSIAAVRTERSLIKVDLLQQALLVVSEKYPPLGLKLAWSLLATIGDFSEGKCSQVQYAASLALLLQLEMIITGGFVSCITDVPACKLLAKVLRACGHQQQELAFDMGALFLVRRRLQEVFDEEELDRQQRTRDVSLRGIESVDARLSADGSFAANTKSDAKPVDLGYTDGKNGPVQGVDNIILAVAASATIDDDGNNRVGDMQSGAAAGSDANDDDDERDLTCVEMLYHLGVGQASIRKSKRRKSERQSRSSVSDADPESSGSKCGSSRGDGPHSLSEIYHPYEGWSAFAEQLDFVENINQLVERLRFVDRPDRSNFLRKEVELWNEDGDKSLGWDLTAVAGEPVYRIMRIASEECRVFRTKARAPSLIVCEVLRDDLVAYYKDENFMRLLKEQQLNLQQHYQESLAMIIENRTPRISVDGNEVTETVPVLNENLSPEKAVELAKAAAAMASVQKQYLESTVHISMARQTLKSKIDFAHNQRKHGLNDDGDAPHLSLRSRSGSGISGSGGHGSEGNQQRAKSLSFDVSPSFGDSVDGQEHAHHGSFSQGHGVDRSKTFETTSQSIHDVEGLLQEAGNGKLSEASKAHAQAKAKAANIMEYERLAESLAARDDQQLGGIDATHKMQNTHPYLVTSRSMDSLSNSAAWSEMNSSSQQVPPYASMAMAMHPAGASIPKRPSSSFLSSNRLSLNLESPAVRAATPQQDRILAENCITADTAGEASSPLPSDRPQSTGSLSAVEGGGLHRSPLPGARQIRKSANSKMVDHSYMPGEHDIGLPTIKSMDSQLSFDDNPPSPAITISIPRKESLIGQPGLAKDARSAIFSAPSLSISEAALITSPGAQNEVHSPHSSRTTGLVSKHVMSSAQRLLAAGLIDMKEYEMLLASDQQFRDETAREEEILAQSRVEDAFGETWEHKKERILGDKMYMFGYPVQDEWPGWDLRSYIMKTNDDLRQEVCCLQLMQICKEIFEHFGLVDNLYLKPYRIVSTGANTGLVQVLNDAISLDALKKTEGFTTLKAYFKKTYDTSPERLAKAKLNFASSLAAYSLFSHLLLIKDRHNGNLLIDMEGHIIHIDFGFILGIAPGGAFSLESAPFKLTEEMVDLLGGLDSPLFGEFVTSFTKGFIALQANAENIVSALQVLAKNSTFPCFQGKQASVIIEKLKSRFRSELSVQDAVKHCLDLITNSYCHMGTRQYDSFQWYTNGIMT